MESGEWSVCARTTHPDAQENVDGVGARHVTDGRVSVLVLDGGHFAGKRIWTGKEKEKMTSSADSSHTRRL